MNMITKMIPSMTHEKFKNITGGLQSICIAAAVVIGGVWTLRTFDFLQLRAQRSINVTIKPSQVRIPGDPARYICALVEYTNVGKNSETFYWPASSPFTATRISLDEKGALVMAEPTGVRLGTDIGNRLLPGQAERRVFLAKVDGPGLYYLEFQVQASSEEQRTASKKDRIEEGNTITWADAAYMTVE